MQRLHEQPACGPAEAVHRGGSTVWQSTGKRVVLIIGPPTMACCVAIKASSVGSTHNFLMYSPSLHVK